jgi:outer membrane lipoprotein-sorting protein
VRDLGTEFIATRFVQEAGSDPKAEKLRPQSIDVRTSDGVRVVALTYEAQAGMPAFYAKKETLGLDLRRPFFCTVEAYDNDGQLFEKIVLERVTPKTFDASTFDPKNPAYRF